MSAALANMPAASATAPVRARSNENHRPCRRDGSERRPSAVVLYHYFHPDDVVSARHFSDFCAGLVERGWEVTAMPCNRGCRDETLVFPAHDEWQGTRIRRLWRPRFRQASTLGRVLNAAWMMAAWCATLFRSRRNPPDVLVIGTDPVLSLLIAPVVRVLCPTTRIVHWCFDLYPEGPVAEGMFRADGWLVRILQRMFRKAYGACDLVADLGECMRSRLDVYGHDCRKITLVPWALAEPDRVEVADPTVRRDLFGDNALGLLYSGNMGRAHSFTDFLELARRLRGSGVHFSFGVRGNMAEQLRAAIQTDDSNITLAGFAPESMLVKRLASADIHLVSLRQAWTGVVVPSKFFGSLAVGRPVLFAGSRDAAIARWIEEYQVGWVLDAESVGAVAAELAGLAAAPQRLQSMQQRCVDVYREHFSQVQVMNAWDREMRQLLVPLSAKAH